MTVPCALADDDGGYTFHIYLQTGPLIWWHGKQVDYEEKHTVFAWRVVAAWNASLKFAVDNYEWGRNLSKLRLKFYTGANLSKAPRIDVLVDPTKPSTCLGWMACTVWGDPIEIPGELSVLSHELGHALGLGHNPFNSYGYSGKDWRGWSIGGMYPADYPTFSPADSFVLYALSIRWRSLMNSTPGGQVEFDGNPGVVRYGPEAGPIYSEHGLVWAYYYTTLSEPDGVESPLIVGGWIKRENQTSLLLKPLPRPWSLIAGPVTFYDDTLCMHPLDWDYEFMINRVRYIYQDMRERSELPLARVYPNKTALVLHGNNISLALLDSSYYSPNYFLGGRVVWVPKEHLTESLLQELEEDSILTYPEVIDGFGPGWDKVSKISYRDGRLCLEGLRDRVLVEMRLGRAYKVDAGLAGSATVSAIPPWDFEVAVSHLLGRGLAKIGPEASRTTIAAGVSPYTNSPPGHEQRWV